MTYIAPRTEALARAMCEAVNYSPDEEIPRIACGDDSWHATWHLFQHEAACWIYEHSGGELPERENEAK